MTTLLEQEDCIAQDETPACDPDSGSSSAQHPMQPPKLKDNARAKMCIINNCNQQVLSTLMRMTSANQMWNHLFHAYSGQNYTRKLQGIKSIASLQYTGGPVIDFLDEALMKLHATIVATGREEISLTELCLAMVLNSLPNRFSNTRATLEQDPKNLTIVNVRSKLVDEDQRQRLRGTQSGFANAVQTMCPHKRMTARCWTCTPSSHPSNFTCADCGAKGHKSSRSRSCPKHSESSHKALVTVHSDPETQWELPKPSFPKKVCSVVRKQDLRAVLNAGTLKRKHSTTSNDLKDHYVIDSGCSQSILMNKTKLSNYLPFHTTMTTADDGVLTCIGKGDLVINSNVTVRNVLHCPEVALNLISTSQLCDQGLTMQLASNDITVKRKNSVVLRAKRIDGLYMVHIPPSRSLLLKSSSRTTLLHRRMGHLNLKSLRLLTHLSDGLVLDNDPTTVCDICAQAKATKTPFPPSKSLAKTIGALTHTDICSIGVPALNGNFTMFLVLVDDATRYSTIRLLNHKDDATLAIIQYDRQIHNITGKHMSILQSDNGGEFIGADLRDYCAEHGIFQRTSTPYTPEQNGRAERLNRSILEGISAMLLDCQLPWDFWGLAAEAYIYLKNRSPHASLYRSTPYEQWFRKLPDLTNLRVFGYPCYVYIPAEVRQRKGKGHKLLPKALKMIFVGYSEKHKAWKCFNPVTKTIVHSNNVQFDSELALVNGPRESIPSLLDHAATLNHFSISSPEAGGILDELLPPQTLREEESQNTSVVPESIDPDEPSGLQKDSQSTYSEDTVSVTDANLTDSDDTVELSDTEPSSPSHKGLLVTADSPLYLEAIKGPDAQKWNVAIAQEYQSLAENNVFSKPMLLPTGQLALDTKMVLKLKEAETDGAPRRFKARLCGKGFRQTHLVNFFDTYAPVATYNTLRLFLTLMATMDYEIDVIDVTTAFLLSPIKEEIYIKMPSGYPCKPGEESMVLRLQKCLYGLKQAPMEWNNELDAHLRAIGFKPTVSDPCLYLRESDATYILIYVDDMVVASKERNTMTQIKKQITDKFPCTDKGPISMFLNLHVIRDRTLGTISLSQSTKIANVLVDSQLSKEDLNSISKPSKIPAPPNIMLTKEMSPTDDSVVIAMEKIPYKSILGQILYIAITARPDIATAVSACGRFAHNPGPEHWQAVLQILKYLQGTRNLALVLGGKEKDINVHSYCDADWAGEPDKRKSRSGFVIMVNKSPICWSSKLQASVALSSTEAEYICTSTGSKDVIWTRTILHELGFPQTEPSIIYQDNKSCINIAESRKQQPGVKHIDIRYHFLRDRVASKEIKLVRVPTTEMVADIFTKQLPYPAFSKHRNALRLCFPSSFE